MQVRPRGHAGGAHAGNQLSALDQVAGLHQQFGGVRIARYQSVAMVDVDAFAVAGLGTGGQDHAAGGGKDGRAAGRGEVQAVVARMPPCHRMAAPAVGRAQVGIIRDRHGRRQAGQVGPAPRQRHIKDLQGGHAAAQFIGQNVDVPAQGLRGPGHIRGGGVGVRGAGVECGVRVQSGVDGLAGALDPSRVLRQSARRRAAIGLHGGKGAGLMRRDAGGDGKPAAQGVHARQPCLQRTHFVGQQGQRTVHRVLRMPGRAFLRRRAGLRRGQHAARRQPTVDQGAGQGREQQRAAHQHGEPVAFDGEMPRRSPARMHNDKLQSRHSYFGPA
ncbi:hypothetical protein BOBR111200_24530 [Bordetella bronchialis]